MANYRGPKAKISRAIGSFIPSLGCEKAFKKRKCRPGQHGRSRKKRSEFAIQQLKKQKAKQTYQILEKQFSNLVKKASAQKGVSGHILMQLLEMQLAPTIWRFGISPTIRAARQLVGHRHIHVNGKVVDRPSFQLKAGDIISIAPKAKELQIIKNSLAENKNPYPWLTWDDHKQIGTILEIPQRKMIPEEIDDKAIIEFYAR